jgi:enterochelin esterase-like enzyme
VFYLLHGAFDGDDSWSTVGRAGFIVDNLIAGGDAKPMIVVMPDGHTARFGGTGGGLNTADFVREFTADIKPYVESTYRIRKGRASTAIAGLSMGGAQTLDIAFGDLASYGYVGVFSSGVFSIANDASWESAHGAQLDDAAAKRGLGLVWFSTGKDDFLLDTTKATVAMLKKSTSSTRSRRAATPGSTGASTSRSSRRSFSSSVSTRAAASAELASSDRGSREERLSPARSKRCVQTRPTFRRARDGSSTRRRRRRACACDAAR